MHDSFDLEEIICFLKVSDISVMLEMKRGFLFQIQKFDNYFTHLKSTETFCVLEEMFIADILKK